MSQNQSTARTRHTRNPLKSLAARPLIALATAGMIAGSTGLAVVATASSALPAGTIAGPNNPPTCPQGYILVGAQCQLPNN